MLGMSTTANATLPCICVMKILFKSLILTRLASWYGCNAYCRTVPSAQSNTMKRVRDMNSFTRKKRCSLHEAPRPVASTTRLEQLRVSVGPPPLVVPRKVTDILCRGYDTYDILPSNDEVDLCPVKCRTEREHRRKSANLLRGRRSPVI